jgi:hypothetical protein
MASTSTVKEIATATFGSFLEKPLEKVVKGLGSFVASIFGGGTAGSIATRTGVMVGGATPPDMNVLNQGLADAELPKDKRKRLLLKIKDGIPREKQNVYVRDLVTDQDNKPNPLVAKKIITLHADFDDEEFDAMKMIGDLDQPSPHKKVLERVEEELHQHLDPITDKIRADNQRRQKTMTHFERIIGRRRT